MRLSLASDTLGLGRVKSEIGARGSGSFGPDNSFTPLKAPAPTKRLRGQITTDLTPSGFGGACLEVRPQALRGTRGCLTTERLEGLNSEYEP